MKQVAVIAVLAGIVLLAVVRGSGRPPPQDPMMHFQLGPYALAIPASFRPILGTPGDPRRSQYVWMMIPVEQLALEAPTDLRGVAVSIVVASVHLDASDAN